MSIEDWLIAIGVASWVLLLEEGRKLFLALFDRLRSSRSEA